MTSDQTLIPAWIDGQLAPAEKLAVHQRGLRHKAVSVFLLGPQGLLLQRRALGKYHTPGLWANTCCTHPHWDEDPAICARRRLTEELGISGVALEWRHKAEYRADVGNGLTEHEVVDIYLGTAPDALVITPNTDEVMDTRWIQAADLDASLADDPAQFTPWLQIYMTQHKAAIFGDI